MTEPDMTPLAECTYTQLVDEMKRRFYAGALVTMQHQREDKLGTHTWGPMSSRFGASYILMEQARMEAHDWIKEFMQNWGDWEGKDDESGEWEKCDD